MDTLEDRLAGFRSPVEMLRSSPTGGYAFPFPSEYTSWRDEQEAWRKSVVIFDQSFHMTDFTFEGRDVHRLISDVGVNSMRNLDRKSTRLNSSHSGESRMPSSA